MRRIAQRWPRFLPMLQRLCLAAVLLAAAQAALVHPLSHLEPAHDIAVGLQEAAALPHAHEVDDHDHDHDHDHDAPGHVPGCDTCAGLHSLAFLVDAAKAGPEGARLALDAADRRPAVPRTTERRAPYASRAPPLA